ncbi:MAG: hypothetical protein EP319_01740 [Deltaproteobacteria bacterium]|nr:MAG: hypothetical protein EP319_01740 [Deltaproteobacteria bacterium]
MMERLLLNFFGITCLIESENLEILQRIRDDFSYFVTDKATTVDFQFRHFDACPPIDNIPDFPLIYTSRNSRTFEKNGVRFNDYNGKLLSIYDYNRDICTLYSTDMNRSHEVLYLLIHSRVGKTLDTMGLHRLHAMGVRKDEVDFLFVADTGVGKSTLLSGMLKMDKKLELLSDDCPLIDESGNVYPFPIRLGASSPEPLLKLGSGIYELEREEFGRKFLLSTSELENPIAWSSSRRMVLAFGHRREGACTIQRMGKIRAFLSLVRPMVIGIGLPMILEYWWELGPTDFVRKARIGFKRMCSAIVLSCRAECLEVAIGNDPDENIRTIIKYLRWN